MHAFILMQVRTTFVFNGPETADSLDLNQLDVLRSHKWKRKSLEMTSFDNSEEGLTQLNSKFDATETQQKSADDSHPRYGFFYILPSYAK